MISNLQVLSDHMQTVAHSLYPIVAVLALVFMKLFFTRHILDNKKFNRLISKIDMFSKSIENTAIDLKLKHYQQKQLELLHYQLATDIILKDHRMLEPALTPLKDSDEEDLRIKKCLFPLLSIKKGKLHLSCSYAVVIAISFFIGALLLLFSVAMIEAYVLCLKQSAWQLAFITGLYAAFLLIFGCRLLCDGIDGVRAFKYFRLLKANLKSSCIK